MKDKMLTMSREAARKAPCEADPQKRGHTSNLEVGCVIDLLTDLVVDFEVVSKYCLPGLHNRCLRHGRKKC